MVLWDAVGPSSWYHGGLWCMVANPCLFSHIQPVVGLGLPKYLELNICVWSAYIEPTPHVLRISVGVPYLGVGSVPTCSHVASTWSQHVLCSFVQVMPSCCFVMKCPCIVSSRTVSWTKENSSCLSQVSPKAIRRYIITLQPRICICPHLLRLSLCRFKFVHGSCRTVTTSWTTPSPLILGRPSSLVECLVLSRPVN